MSVDKYDPSIVDGKIARLSVSQLGRFNPNEYGGCQAKWFYKYIHKIPDPPKAAQSFGIDGHKRFEDFYSTPGLDIFKHFLPHDRAALGLLPKPADDVKPEVQLTKLELLRIPFQGSKDLLQVTDTEVKVFDYKYQKQIREFKEPNAQVWGYLQDEVLKYERDFYSFTHVHISSDLTKTPKAKAFTKRFAAREVERNWLQYGTLVKEMQDVAAEPDINKVPVNEKACFAYGPCPYLAICHKNNKKEQELMSFLDTLSSITKEESSAVKIPEVPGILPPDAPVETKPGVPLGEDLPEARVTAPEGPVEVVTFEKPKRGRPAGSKNRDAMPTAPSPQSVFEPQPSVPLVECAPVARTTFKEADRIKVRHTLKIGLPNYSSAEVSLEIETEGGLTSFKDLSDKVRSAVAEEAKRYAPEKK